MEVIYCDKSDFPYNKELLVKERIRSLWEQIFFFKRSSNLERDIIVIVPILKRDAIDENRCLIP